MLNEQGHMDKSVSTLSRQADQQSHLPINVLMWKTFACVCVLKQSTGPETDHPCGCHWFPVNWMITTLACNTTVNHCCQSMWARHYSWTAACMIVRIHLNHSSCNHTNWSGAACISCYCSVYYSWQVIKSICCECTLHTSFWKDIFG